MLATIEGMISELRQIGVPISVTETIDAVRSLRHVSLDRREDLKSALRAVLIKSHDHELAFDAVFDLYFTAVAGDRQGLSVAEATATAADLHDVTDNRSLGSVDDSALNELLFSAVQNADEVLMRVIADTFVDRHASIEPGRPVAGTYYVFRTLRAVDLDALLARLAEADHQPDDAPALLRRLQVDGYEAQIQRFRQAVESVVRQRLVHDRGATNVARTLRQPLPEDVDFLSASRDQVVAMRSVIEPLTRKMAARLAEKRKHRHRGALDFRATVRRSLNTGGVPLDPVFRKPRPPKPELFVLADISGSVSTFAAFTLQLMFALRSQFSRVRSFVFADGIDEVTDILQAAPDVIEATRHINASGSGVWLDGRSDYGHALESFWQHWGQQVRRRTTVIVLGDARSNYHEPGEGALKAISARAAHLFWLNPEPRGAWNTGDSVIGRYRPFCDALHECRNIRQLRQFVEQLD